MITAELIEEEKKIEEMKKMEFQKLEDIADSTVNTIRKIFPGRKIRISIEDASVDYWLDGNCYSVNRSFYFPKD